MTLPRKGLRQITVDGVPLQYSIRKAKDLGRRRTFNASHYMEEPAGFMISVQAAQNPRSSFKYLFAYEPAYEDHPKLTPALIARIVRMGFKRGWRPDQPGNLEWEGARWDFEDIWGNPIEYGAGSQT